ncbi:MAG: hypothetical protein JW708_00510 [Vallitaleaceae bacterium]|nr:hypothetical protein [Vallitaleaceae bacterium]
MEQSQKGQLVLPKLFSEGMVLQRNTKAPIWGRALKGEEIEIFFCDQRVKTKVGEDGKWRIDLMNLVAGGPFILRIVASNGEEISIKEVWVGEVWMAAGQSNMELPIERVADDEIEELKNPEVPLLHLLKVQEKYDFYEEQEDVISEGWMTPKKENLSKHSALCYFFGKKMAKELGIPIGIINASLGGSPIEAWMKEADIREEKELFEQLSLIRKEEYAKNLVEDNLRCIESWYADLYARDQGIQALIPWYAEEGEEGQWKSCTLPGFFDEFIEKSEANEQEPVNKGFCGSIWLRKTFELGEDEVIKEEAKLWLGTMVDSDWTYVNGHKIGQTEYQYPPRKYKVPKGLLKKGKNTIVIRVLSNKGMGRVTPNKEMRLFFEEEYISLEGPWEYRIGAYSHEAPEMIFLNRTPTALYHAMLSPCIPYGISGFLWYQGESNTAKPNSYERLLNKMICSLRVDWETFELPFLCVQLPGFSIDLEEEGSGWPEVREAQRASSELVGVRLISTIDLGQYNELHPTNKKKVAQRLVKAALSEKFGEMGPKLLAVELEDRGIRLRFECSVEGMEFQEHGLRKDKKGNSNFVVAFSENKEANLRVEGCVEDNTVFLKVKEDGIKRIRNSAWREIRYAYENAPEGSLLFDKNGFPASPFLKRF